MINNTPTESIKLWADPFDRRTSLTVGLRGAGFGTD